MKTIKVTSCDNELYLVIFSWKTRSYELCHIKSGYNFKVNVTVNVTAGAWAGRPQVQDGLTGALDTTVPVVVPAGEYTLTAFGLDWGPGGHGGQSQFSFTVDGNKYEYPHTYDAPYGVAWTVTGIPFVLS